MTFVEKTTKFIKSKKGKFILVTLLVVLILGGWLFFKQTNGDKPQYQTQPVERGTIVSSVSGSGQVLTVNIMSANTKVSGIVKEVYVQDGDMVQKGDKILEIELDLQGEQKQAQFWSNYLSAKNALEKANYDQYTYQAEMFDNWDVFLNLSTNSTYQNDDGSPNYENRSLPEFHIAEKEWLAAEAKFKNQEQVVVEEQIALNSSWLNYQQNSSTITSPTDGIITSLMFSEGMTIGTLDTGNTTSNQKVATIETGGLPIISINLSEIDVSKVEIGQTAIITLDSLPDRTFTGKVIGVDRIGQTTSGVTQYPANIQLDTSANEILPNMTTTANIILERKNSSLLVPSTAVQTQDNQSYVTVLVNGKEQSVLVQVGLVSDTQTEIISGLKEGDEIVISKTTSTSTKSGDQSPFGGGSGFRMMH